MNTETLRMVAPGPTVGRIVRTLDYIQAAEEEIDTAQHQHPDYTEALWAAFGILKPGPIIGLEPALYRHHCQELLERVTRNHDLSDPTQAELLAALSQMSLVAPLSQENAAIMARLFATIYPERAGISQPLDRQHMEPEIKSQYRKLSKAVKTNRPKHLKGD